MGPTSKQRDGKGEYRGSRGGIEKWRGKGMVGPVKM